MYGLWDRSIMDYGTGLWTMGYGTGLWTMGQVNSWKKFLIF